MRILLIAPSTNPLTYKGLGKYSREILEGMRSRVEVDFIQKTTEQDKVISTHTEIPIRLISRRLSDGYDVVHALAPEMGVYSPILYANSVVTFHDLIPIRAFRDMSFRFSWIVSHYTKTIWRMAARAKGIIANSSQTRNELIHILHTPPKKIRVIPLGVDGRFRPVHRERPQQSTVGFFGNYTYRKRVDIALSTFKLISKKKPDADLVLAGGEIQTIYQRHFDLEKLVAGVKNVKLLGHIAEEQLPGLYNSFKIMLFPSSYEGFGLPILESQRCGVPVLTLRHARIPEEVRKESVVCNDAEDMAAKAVDLLENTRRWREISRRGMQYAAGFTWERTVKETLSVYENCESTEYLNRDR